MITDEGASFLSDLKRYETKHESYISLLNQLFDGKGEKMTLAKNVERPVPRNATSLSIGVQQKSFCDAIYGYETKHESYISLLNQLFDGKGDKMTLAKNVERPVPRNATSLSIGVQQKSFCNAIFGFSETLWLHNGFGERFIFSAARPYRYLYAQTYINFKQ